MNEFVNDIGLQIFLHSLYNSSKIIYININKIIKIP